MTEACQCWAYLNEKDPRAELWQQILGESQNPNQRAIHAPYEWATRRNGLSNG